MVGPLGVVVLIVARDRDKSTGGPFTVTIRLGRSPRKGNPEGRRVLGGSPLLGQVGEVLVTCCHSHHVLKVRVGHADRELEGSLSHWHVLALSLQLHLQILEQSRLWHELLLLLLLLL